MSTASEVLTNGSVKWFNAEKGYGFIQADGLNKDVFLHVKQLRSSGITGNLLDGEQVRFVCNDGPKGPFATNITRGNGGPDADGQSGAAR